MIYKMTATSLGGNTFVYHAEGPDDLTDSEVSCEFYAQHGRSLRSGEQTDPLGPEFTIERLS